MSINDRLFHIMELKHIKNNTLAERLNVKPQIITNWKTRGTTPPMEYLPTICDVLGVSWEYLITGEENTFHLTKEERTMIELLREVLPESHERIINYIAFEIYQQKKTQP